MRKSHIQGKNSSKNKTAKIAARCTPSFKKSTVAFAKANSMTESELIAKMTALLLDGKIPLPKADTQILTSLICENNAIGKNLNQIAYQLNRDNTKIDRELIIELRKCQQTNVRTLEQLTAFKNAGINTAIEYRKNLRD